MKNPLIALMKFYNVPLTLENFNRLRYAGVVPELIGPEDEADTPEEVLICDFCPGTPVAARYRDWAACPECERIIDAGDWDALLERSVAGFFEKYEECDGLLSPVFVREHLHALYKDLRRNGFEKER